MTRPVAPGPTDDPPTSSPVRANERANERANDRTADRAAELVRAGAAHYRAGRLDDARSALEEAAALLPGRPNDAALERALMLGRTLRDLGRFAGAERSCSEALATARELASPREAEALHLLAGVIAQRGEYAQALGHLETALELARRHSLVERQATVLDTTGVLQGFLGNYSRALEHLKLAYDLLRDADADARNVVANLVNLGNLYHNLGDHSEALVFLSRARDVAREADDATMEAAALNNIANVHRENERWGAARASFEEALELSRQIANRAYEIDNLDGLGQVQVALGDAELAAETHRRALRIAREIRDAQGEIDALFNLGRDLLALGRARPACDALHEGVATAERLEQRRSVFEGHALLADAYEALGDPATALIHHRRFHAAEKEVFNRESEERTRQLHVQFEVERARHDAETYRLRNEVEHRARRDAEARVRERTQELEEAQFEVVARLAFAGECRDDDTGEHTRRVGRTAAAIGFALGWPEARVKLIYSAARLHDVGKIGISDRILHKPGALTDDEFARMRDHTTVGARILSDGRSKLLKMAEEIALAHHERWDGEGYPLGLAGEAIPETARVVAVADVLDALVHERPYKRAWSVDDALAEIARQSGRQFDPRVVAACQALFGGGALTPLDDDQGWDRTLEQLHALPLPCGAAAPTEDPGKVRERYERLLDLRTQHLESARREARSSARRMQAIAHTDPLTELGNRRAFDADLRDAVDRSAQRGERVSLAVIDLDGLKALNDRYGHERGDRYLEAVAAAFDRHLRELGRVYRTGGDEFALLVVHRERLEHEVLTARLSDALASVREREPAADACWGVATHPDEAPTLDILLELSDQRMYAGKRRRLG